MSARLELGVPAAVAASAWCLLLHQVFEHTWTFGPRTFVCVVLLGGLVAASRAMVRQAGPLGLLEGPRLRTGLAWIALVAATGFTAAHLGTLYGHLFGARSDVRIADVGLNTGCAADRLFERAENPYDHRCQLKSVAGAPHVHVDGRGTTMYGVPYDYGYPYFPVMFASYEPFCFLVESYRSILYGNLAFYAATIVGILWLALRLAPPPARRETALVAVVAYSCVLGLGREIFYAGHTDGVIAVYAVFGFIALTYGRHRTAGALFGLALAAKLVPGAIFAAVLVAWYVRRPERWRFIGALAATVAVTIVPFLIWDGRAFLSATILFYLTLHAPGDDTALWFFLPDGWRLPFTVVGAAGMVWLFARQARARGATVRDVLRTCVLLNLVLLAFSKMMHLNYLLAILPLGAVVLAVDATARPAVAPPAALAVS